MTPEHISEALEHFYENLPQKPDWIVLNLLAGPPIAAIKIDIKDEERYQPVFVTVMPQFVERVSPELGLGNHSFSIIAAHNGFVFVTPVTDNLVLGMKFSTESNLAQIANFLTLIAANLDELSEQLAK